MTNGAPVNVLDFGADPTGATDSLSAFNAAIAYALDTTSTYYTVSNQIFIPRGTYLLNGTWTISAQVHIIGEGQGNFNSNAIVKLNFPANTPGIVFTQSPTTATNSILQNVTIASLGNTTYNKAAHGIDLKTRATIRDVVVTGFGGNGINVNTVGGGANVNIFVFINVWSRNNGGHGIYTVGGDSNAGTGTGISCSNNGQYGICDESFLGNTWVGCHTENNGIQLNGNTISLVTYSGNHYACLSSTINTTTVPGTNSAVWELLGAGSVSTTYPAWSSGNNYIYGGSFKSNGTTASSVFVGCYIESGQPPAWISGSSLVVGGTFQGPYIGGVIPFIASTNGVVTIPTGVNSTTLAYNSTSAFNAQLGGSQQNIISYAGTAFDSSGQPTSFRASGKDSIWTWVTGTSVSALLTGTETAYTFGRSSSVPYRWQYPEIFLGSANSSRSITFDSAIPTTGQHAAGDKIFNNAPAVGQPKGWVCTASGTPGTWVSEGNL